MRIFAAAKASLIIILPTDRPEKVLPTARTTKNGVAFARYGKIKGEN